MPGAEVDVGGLPELSAEGLVEARSLRGRLPMVTGPDLLWNVLGLIGPAVLAVLFWLVEPGGTLSRSGLIAMVVAMALGGPITWRERVRPRTMGWSMGPAVVGMGLIAWGIDLSTWPPSAGDRFYRGFGVCLSVAVLFTLGQRVGQARALSRLDPVQTPVLTAAPGMAVLLALDNVAMARTPRIASVLGMPEEMAKSWLAHLCGLRLVQGSMGDRYSLTPAGRDLLDQSLAES